MNRRSFLSMMGFVAPAVIVKPSYFFAPPGGWGVKIYTTIGEYADYPPKFGGAIHPYVLRDLLEDPQTATGIDLLFGTSTLKMPWTLPELSVVNAGSLLMKVNL